MPEYCHHFLVLFAMLQGNELVILDFVLGHKVLWKQKLRRVEFEIVATYLE